MKPPAKNTGGSLRAVKLNPCLGLVPPDTKHGCRGLWLPNDSRDTWGIETRESTAPECRRMRYKTQACDQDPCLYPNSHWEKRQVRGFLRLVFGWRTSLPAQLRNSSSLCTPVCCGCKRHGAYRPCGTITGKTAMSTNSFITSRSVCRSPYPVDRSERKYI